MTDEPGAAAHVLLALDPGAAEEGPVSLALQLAGTMHAALTSLLIEDAKLLGAARLPFAREVGLASAAVQTLAGGELEQMLRRRADRIQHFVASQAARSRIPVSFRTSQGDLHDELGAALRRTDIVVAAARRRVVARLGMSQQAGRRTEAISVLFDPSAAGVRALHAALALVGAHSERLRVLAAGPLSREHMRLLDALLQRAPAARRVSVEVPAAAMLARQLTSEGSRALVLGSGAVPDAGAGLAALLEMLPCPLVLVP